MQRLVVGAFFFCVLAAPFPLGANRDWAWATMVVGLGVVFVAFATTPAATFSLPRPAWGAVSVAFVGFSVAFAWSIAQVLLGSNEAIAAPAGLFRLAADTLALPPRLYGTLNPDASLHGLIKLGALGSVFLVSAFVCRSRRAAQSFMVWFAIAAVLVTTYGMLTHARAGSCFIFEYAKRGTDVFNGEPCLFSGTFVSSNTYATYAGLGILAMFALATEAAQLAPSGDRLTWRDLARLSSGRLMILLAGTLYLLGGILMSGSRAGVISLVIAAFVFWALVAARSGRAGAIFRVVLPTCGAVLLLALLLSGEAMTTKVRGFTEGDISGRTGIWAITLRAIESARWSGWGLGAFADAFALFQTIEVLVPNDKAHSTPLEIIAEIGLPAGSALIVAVCALLWRCFRGVFARRRDIELPAVAFAAGALAMGHSLVDFSLQIPAVAVTIAALLGLGVAQSVSLSGGARPDGTHGTRPGDLHESVR